MTSLEFSSAGLPWSPKNLTRVVASFRDGQARSETLALKFQKKHLNNLRPVQRHLEI
jgi:hypothetical protein